MSADVSRTWHICEVCKKRFSMQNSDYKQRMSRSKSGRLYCSKACHNAGVKLFGKKYTDSKERTSP